MTYVLPLFLLKNLHRSKYLYILDGECFSRYTHCLSVIKQLCNNCTRPLFWFISLFNYVRPFSNHSYWWCQSSRTTSDVIYSQYPSNSPLVIQLSRKYMFLCRDRSFCTLIKFRNSSCLHWISSFTDLSCYYHFSIFFSTCSTLSSVFTDKCLRKVTVLLFQSPYSIGIFFYFVR